MNISNALNKNVGLAIVAQYVSRAIVYRVQSLVWMLTGIMPIAVLMVWFEVSQERDIYGYSRADLSVYFLSMYVVRQVTSIWVLQRVDEDIRRGRMAFLLIRPVAPIYCYALEHVAEKMVRVPIILIVFCVGVMLANVVDRFQVGKVIAFLPALLLAWAIIFLLYYCLGLIAFWINNVLAFDALLWTVYTVLGGALIPIDLYPQWMGAVLRLLPFAASLDFPIQILMGKQSLMQCLEGFLLQLFWLMVLMRIHSALWRRGRLRYGAAGV